MGYGVIAVTAGVIQVLEVDALKLPVKEDSYVRLQLIHEKVTELVKVHRPHTFAIEAPFFGKNVQSMLKLGRAQGVAIAAAMSGGIPVTEYSPKRVKQAITGNGNADKEQVWQMLHRIVKMEESPKSFDATDALAVAICHYFSDGIPQANRSTGRARNPRKAKAASAWDAFIAQNPGRLG
ncbi:crossover junction endodeoxyribonuclease RuvC [Flaviaesturariibacter flavus]|uniref:Crossover junction endodeoxyribonuclease RuvC n=2 Tax=Flaviaesturariibacter flavus TaxID=2502780 RepID=A0A4R1BNB0_9BACT|nr:crossover junction endodeoxyribonuclease RuvC [Flaviaesturariibacter flavus]